MFDLTVISFCGRVDGDDEGECKCIYLVRIKRKGWEGEYIHPAHQIVSFYKWKNVTFFSSLINKKFIIPFKIINN